MPKPLVGPVNVLKRLYLTVLVLTSVSDIACFAHSGFVLHGQVEDAQHGVR